MVDASKFNILIVVVVVMNYDTTKFLYIDEWTLVCTSCTYLIVNFGGVHHTIILLGSTHEEQSLGFDDGFVVVVCRYRRCRRNE